MPMPRPAYCTAEMVRGFPDDGNRYEVVHGELLVTPAPSWLHQRMLRRLCMALAEYLQEHPIGEVLFSPADISWGPDTLVQPDLFVVPQDQSTPLEWTSIRTLLLAVEVLSPSSVRADRFTKRRLYQERRVPLYWIVDTEHRQVEVWTPDAVFPVVERELLQWQPEGPGRPFVLRLQELFRQE